MKKQLLEPSGADKYQEGINLAVDKNLVKIFELGDSDLGFAE